jgi:hypothetical protein
MASKKRVKKSPFKNVVKKKAVKKPAKASAGSGAKKAAGKATKKVTAKATKEATKKATKKATCKSTRAAPPATLANVGADAARIESITPTKDGGHWSLRLGSGVRVKVAASAAQTAGVKVGGSWSAALATRVLEAAIEQEMFTRAMSMLAQDGRMSRASLVDALGGDARARKAVASLAEHGWTA